MLSKLNPNFMKTKQILLLAALAAGIGVDQARAQKFSSGSTGADGALNVTANTTIDLPPDGRLNYTTVNVATSVTLNFRRNALNTPVFLLAQGDVVIDGVIDVSGSRGPGNVPTGGAGGPGGFDGGKPGFGTEIPPGNGYGPGGGKGGNFDLSPNGAGAGSFGNVPDWPEGGNNHGKVIYGSPLLIPMIGGSGGGGSAGSPGIGGGGGGGAILIASSTKITVSANGQIYARGGGRGNSPVNAGSGGAIRLLAPLVNGTGRIDVFGGEGDGSAAEGRIRVDTIDRSALQFSFQPNSQTTVGANMFVFPAKVPRLDITDAAGTAIVVGTLAPVTVQLPFGADTNKTITVQAKDFGAKVPISVVLTPDSGDRIIVPASIDNTTQNPATVVVPVGIPPNVVVTVNVWTQ